MRTEGPSRGTGEGAAAGVRRGDFSDFERLAQEVRGWGLDWIQLDRGCLDARLQQVAFRSALLTRFGFSRKFHQRGDPPPGMRTFGLNGIGSPEIEWRGALADSGHLVVFPAADQFEMVSHPGFFGDTISVAEARIRSESAILGLPDPLEGLPSGQVFVEADPRRLSSLRAAISQLHRWMADCGRVFQGDAGVTAMEGEVVAALVLALQSRDLVENTPEPARRGRALRQAVDFIESHTDEPPSVRAICGAAEVSWRTLNYAFRDRFGVTPKQYLQAARLHRVRQRLLQGNPEDLIADIANEWGFWHLGQFAADYRRQFGELPSESLRRSGAV